MTRVPRPAAAFGRAAESLAERYLRESGYEIVGRNVRGPSGEIDLIARRKRLIVFVEVKARSTGAYGAALGAVDRRKRARIRAAAADFLQIHAPYAAARFDVLAIDGDRVRHHPAAF